MPIFGHFFGNAPAAARFEPLVDGAALLDDITAELRRHVVFPNDGAETSALFVLHAHGHGAARVSPLLALVSPVIGCGKTTALTVLAELVPEPLFVSDLTPAGLVPRPQPRQIYTAHRRG
jgi:hypothetical protein